MQPSFRFLFALLCIVPLAVLSLPAQNGLYEVKEHAHPPHGWIQHSVPPADHTISLRIGLPQPNFNILETHLYEVSDPGHHRYGQHLSKEEVEELVAPHPESLQAVNEWLASHGIQEDEITRSPAKDWITLTIPIGMAEKMLDTKYHVWKNLKTGDDIVRTTSYSLPIGLHEHVDVIQPTTMFAQFKPFRSTIVKSNEEPSSVINDALGSITNPATGLTVDASCNQTITISCLNQLYNAVGYKQSSTSKNSIGVTGYVGEYANLADLQQFYAEQRPDARGSSFRFISVNGGLNDQSKPGFEANLDVQFALGISYPILATFYSTAGTPPFKPDVITPTNTNEPYSDWLDSVINQVDIPLTISTSYGDDEQTVPESFARRVCSGFAQLGARGVSVVFSSGDFGVGDGNPDPATQTCFTNDGNNQTKFIPVFPATCPFVTSVGATQNISPEVAVSRFFSGGGFSNYFLRPAYQKRAVPGYLDTLEHGTYQGLFNRNGRGVPDIAAQGDRFRIIVGGQPAMIGGTSAAAPALAGFIALLNEVRLRQGRPPLGFLNPFIYSIGSSGFTDILSGHNSGCGTPGFNVTKGWDPVTGLGTPNFGRLKNLV
ncbi:tripeptidyl peptidase A [Pluteus cervinus]|uniref:Tripeptidyl peptidase A n=1 Tax=Pluteus cervinus TaxID=181527 RepID=A0ACD3AE58_9AGAR|nr:tripeptidyl peptidase A [Pluteus cervinus]